MTHTQAPIQADVELAACCGPAAREPISAESAGTLAGSLKVLADPSRLRLVSIVAAHDGGDVCVCELTEPLGLSQPTVSHHLKILVEAGFVTRSQRGQWAYYRLVPGVLGSVARQLATF